MKQIISNLWARITGRTRLMANTYNAPNAGVSRNGIKSFQVDAAIGRFRVVKRGAGTPATEFVQVHAGETDIPLGITLDEVTAAEFTADGAETTAHADGGGRRVSVAILGAVQGTLLVQAGAAITIDDYVCSNGDGTVKAHASSNYFIGKALTAAQAAGDIIEIAPFTNPVVMA